MPIKQLLLLFFLQYLLMAFPPPPPPPILPLLQHTLAEEEQRHMSKLHARSARRKALSLLFVIQMMLGVMTPPPPPPPLFTGLVYPPVDMFLPRLPEVVGPYLSSAIGEMGPHGPYAARMLRDRWKNWGKCGNGKKTQASTASQVPSCCWSPLGVGMDFWTLCWHHLHWNPPCCSWVSNSHW